MPIAPLLAFDTSTELLAVALQVAGRAWHVQAEGGARASATLLPHVESLLAQAGIGFGDLGHIAFGNGPGAFTGLRTACAVAQGLGLGLGIPLLPIPSLLIVAEDARAQLADALGEAGMLDVGVAMDARMDEVYAGRWRWHGGRWHTDQPPALLTLPQLAAAWAAQPPALLAGSALEAFGTRLPLPPAARRCPQTANRAAALLRLALAAAAEGPGVDAAEALPLYLRDKVAQTTAERDAARAILADAAADAAATAAGLPTT
jgi:tRNA threonylcarbamoyladenosine biosynthesis protein TsaB